MDQDRCAGFGLSFGSSEFGKCMMDISFQRSQLESEERRTRMETSAIESIARDRQRDREETQRRTERQNYEAARARREGCDRNMKPIYC